MLLATKEHKNSEKKARGLFFKAKIYFVKKNKAKISFKS